MKIKCVKPFRDKTTAKNIKDQKLIKVGDILVCDDELANDRIRKGLVIEIIEEVVEEVETTEATEEVVEKKSRKRK